MTEPVHFQLNGQRVDLRGTDPTESLLRWLKRERLTGTKEGCADGDCGACTVTVVELDSEGAAHYRAVNSCLLPVGALPGREILTVEALAAAHETPHPVQQALIDCAGSQCGYCTPGFVMSLFAGYYDGELGDATTEGNLCRCTGYQPIRRATEQLVALPQADDRFRRELSQPRAPMGDAALEGYFNPTTIDQALQLKARHPEASWIAGATDLGVNLSHGQHVATTFIGLDRIAALRQLVIEEDRVRIGAGVPLTTLEHTLAGLFPALDQMLPWFAARQVRNRATLGGNLGSASPIGDLLPVLLALDAVVHCAGPAGERDIAIADFFLDYRKTARAADELIVAISVPRRPALISAAYKVAKRQTDDISIVAAVFALTCDTNGSITHARLAYGGVAAIPRRALAVETWLHGRRLDDDTVAQAAAMLQQEFQPLSDHRASARYRAALCGSLFRKFVAQLPHAATDVREVCA